MQAASTTDLFPTPIPKPPSPLTAQRWPGATDASAQALVHTLKLNHEKWHVFFNDKHFHNHTAHQLLALYALGGDAKLIEAAYAHDAESQKPAYSSPSTIDSQNWIAHLGDENYYNAYLNFFAKQIKEKGYKSTLEDYVFSDAANFAPEGKPQPHMLIRLNEGLLHPLIHVGYGCEFGLPGVLAEGLAQTAVHASKSLSLMPPSLWKPADAGKASGSSLSVSVVITGLSSLTFGRSAGKTASASATGEPDGSAAQQTGTVERRGVHALTILAKLLKDPVEAPMGPDDDHAALADVLADSVRSKHITALADEWVRALDLARPGELAAKVEELAWMNALMYGIGGWERRAGAEFHADFFLMHLATSSLFVPAIAAHVGAAAQRRLLGAYLTVALATFVSRGRPALRLADYFSSPAPVLRPPGPQPTPHATALHPEGEDKDDAGAPRNPWHALAQSALYHPEEHTSKLVRSLAHWAALFGTRAAGHFAPLADGDDGLPGAEKLDGSLFARAASMSLDRVGWAREGQEAKFWDR